MGIKTAIASTAVENADTKQYRKSAYLDTARQMLKCYAPKILCTGSVNSEIYTSIVKKFSDH